MKYINPYDIANSLHFNELNIKTFKKFKKRLFAELELSNCKIIVNRRYFQQNEIVEMMDSIDRNKELLEVYETLYENKNLNSLLSKRSNLTYLKNLKNILSLEDKKIINFITPYLVDIFSDVYKLAFNKNDAQLIQLIPPLDEIYYEKIYEKIYKLLKFNNEDFISLLFKPEPSE